MFCQEKGCFQSVLWVVRRRRRRMREEETDGGDEPDIACSEAFLP
jgi:hypothetical protein